MPIDDSEKFTIGVMGDVTKIRNSMGNYYMPTAENIQKAIDDFFDPDADEGKGEYYEGMVWLPSGYVFNVNEVNTLSGYPAGIMVNPYVYLDLGGSIIKPAEDLNVVEIGRAGGLSNGTIDVSGMSSTYKKGLIYISGRAYHKEEFGIGHGTNFGWLNVSNMDLISCKTPSASAPYKGIGVYFHVDNQAENGSARAGHMTNIKTQRMKYSIYFNMENTGVDGAPDMNGAYFTDFLMNQDQNNIVMDRAAPEKPQPEIAGNIFDGIFVQTSKDGTGTVGYQERSLDIDSSGNQVTNFILRDWENYAGQYGKLAVHFKTNTWQNYLMGHFPTDPSWGMKDDSTHATRKNTKLSTEDSHLFIKTITEI